MCFLHESLGLNPPEVCSSNLIFVRSVTANYISFDLAKTCWPFHEAVLHIVQPKLILAIGNSSTSAYKCLHKLMGGAEEYISSGHGHWHVKGFSI